MYGWSSTVSIAFAAGMSTEMAVTSGFATITSAASLSPKTKTLSIICCSPTSISPSRVERETSMRSSASESTSRSAPTGSTPNTRSTASVERCSTQMSGCATVKNARTGADTHSAVPSECRSATPFGTSSPSTTWKNVRMRYASAIASAVAAHLSNSFVRTCSPTAPMASEVSVTPSCIAAMKRGGSPVMRSTARARRFPWC